VVSVEQQRVVGEAGVSSATLGVEDPELGPATGRPEPGPGDGRLGGLADDVASEPDPRSSDQLQAQPGRLGHGRSQASGQVRRLEDDDERLGPAGQGGQPVEPLGDARRPVDERGPRRQVDDEHVDRSPRQQRAGDGQALVERVRGQDDEPFEPDAASHGLDRIQAAGQVQPGNDRAVGLGLGHQPQGQRGSAARPGAPDRDTGTARQAATAEDRVELGEARPDDPLGRFGRKRRGIHRVRQGCRCQGTHHARSCRAPARLEGRQGGRHIRREGRHGSFMLEHLFDLSMTPAVVSSSQSARLTRTGRPGRLRT
jgi:hypothetical protein